MTLHADLHRRLVRETEAKKKAGDTSPLGLTVDEMRMLIAMYPTWNRRAFNDAPVELLPADAADRFISRGRGGAA